MGTSTVPEIKKESEVMLKEEFIHFRTVEADGKNIAPRGGVTICYLPTENGKASYMGISICSGLDNYQKKKGVQSARGRAVAQQVADELNDWEPDNSVLTREQMFTVAKQAAVMAWERICTRHERAVVPLVTSV